MAGHEGERPRVERTSQQSRPADQLKPQQESRERKPLPSVWAVLEHRVRVQERYSSLGELPGRRVFNKLYHDDLEVRRAEDAIREEGTPRDKHILDLFYRTQPVLSMSREEFQEFRARADALSDEDIAEELRKHFESIRERTPQSPAFYSGVGIFDVLKRKEKQS